MSKDLRKEQEALQKFDRFFHMNPALMAVSKMPERIFVDVNNAFLQVTGYGAEEIVGKTSRELDLFVDGEEQQRVSAILVEYGFFREVELRIRTKNGEVRHGLFSGEVIESQGVQYLLTVMVDITERKQMEARQNSTILELRSALAEIKTLRGIVPICASCKEIRDDKGYWNQVESYISKHTEAQFSHGICPDCLEKLYPGFTSGTEDAWTE